MPINIGDSYFPPRQVANWHKEGNFGPPYPCGNNNKELASKREAIKKGKFGKRRKPLIK